MDVAVKERGQQANFWRELRSTKENTFNHFQNLVLKEWERQ
jgi:hypothetical protein